jgi:hypothetical protein
LIFLSTVAVSLGGGPLCSERVASNQKGNPLSDLALLKHQIWILPDAIHLNYAVSNLHSCSTARILPGVVASHEAMLVNALYTQRDAIDLVDLDAKRHESRLFDNVHSDEIELSSWRR